MTEEVKILLENGATIATEEELSRATSTDRKVTMNTPEEKLAELIYNKLVLLFATEPDPEIRRTFGIALLNVYFHHTPDTDVKDFEAEGLIETNPNTPDTENELHNCGDPRCLRNGTREKNTPDREWEKEFDEEINKMLEVGQGFLEGEWEQNNLKNFITTLLTSRDTYWKEKIEGMNVMHFCECKRQCFHTQRERDTLLDNLK